MWSWLASFITGPIINGLIGAYKAKLAAGNTQDAQAVQLAVEEIRGEVAQRQTEASIIRQEQGWWVTAIPRPLFAFIFVVYIGKCVIWDKVLGWGSTEPLSNELAWAEHIILVGYFSARTIEKVARTFNRNKQ
jgi:hypothetical protein